MKKLSFKEILIPTISLFIICVVVAFLLAGTNELTKAPIAKIQAETSQAAMKSVVPEAESFETIQDDPQVNAGYDASGNLVGYAIPSVYKGYGGDVEIMVGVGVSGDVTGVEILSHEETPGLGANCIKEDFRNQFVQSDVQNGFSVVKDGTGGENGHIDAMTGATITSNAVTQAVNQALDVYNSLEGGEN